MKDIYNAALKPDFFQNLRFFNSLGRYEYQGKYRVFKKNYVLLWKTEISEFQHSPVDVNVH